MRNEVINPQFRRSKTTILNGEYDFAFDDNDIGLKEKWYLNNDNFNLKINVPFVYQSKLSGIDIKDNHEIVWYQRKLEVEHTDQRVILNFGAIDYEAMIFINSSCVMKHTGGHTSFKVDISDYLNYDNDLLSIRVYDPMEDEEMPRGKQFWELESRGIWYTRSTGIWQSVSLEYVNNIHIKDFKITPNIDLGNIDLHVNFSSNGGVFKYLIILEDEEITSGTVRINDSRVSLSIDIFNNKIFNSSFHNSGKCWTPENPVLYDLILTYEDDEVSTYFGMRKIHQEEGMIYLNNRPYYQKLVLDQGYWPNGLLSAPSDADYIKDIELAKSMGFNGCRKHQKIEDPRFLYWADVLGFIVWAEMPSGISYSNNYVERVSSEWIEAINRDYNHPCIVAWVPLNESWAIPNVNRSSRQKSHCAAMYYLTHSLDETRLVISNDGWELSKSDIIAIHNYNHGPSINSEEYHYFKRILKTRELLLSEKAAGKKIFIDGFNDTNQPIILSEFGGVAFQTGQQNGWGYTVAKNEEDFIQDLQRIFDALYESDCLYGFCYTQFCDVEQEINGLLNYDRSPKVELQKIKKIIDRSIYKTIR